MKLHNIPGKLLLLLLWIRQLSSHPVTFSTWELGRSWKAVSYYHPHWIQLLQWSIATTWWVFPVPLKGDWRLQETFCPSSPPRLKDRAGWFLKSNLELKSSGKWGLDFWSMLKVQRNWRNSSAATIWQSRKNSMLKRSQCQRTIVKSGEGFATGCNRKGVST